MMPSGAKEFDKVKVETKLIEDGMKKLAEKLTPKPTREAVGKMFLLLSKIPDFQVK